MATQGMEPTTPQAESSRNTISECRIDMVSKMLRDIAPSPDDDSQSACNLFKVPENLRQTDPPAYKPDTVPIGLFHYCDPNQDTPMQNYKWRCLWYLIYSRDTTQGGLQMQILDECWIKLTQMEKEIRSCYPVDLQNLESDKLALIMLLDGSFIIRLFLDAMESSDVGGFDRATFLSGMPSSWKTAASDVLKLENQIPFLVIKALFPLLVECPSDRGDKQLLEHALSFLIEINPLISSHRFPTIKILRKMPPIAQIHHLLHMFHLLLTMFLENDIDRYGPYLAERQNFCSSIPCATELRFAGVQLRRKRVTYQYSFLGITLQGCRRLAIPPLRIHEHTNCLFRNLIAFEEGRGDAGEYVKWYVGFMECIIHTVEDVQLLQSKGIIRNELRTEQDLVSLFNQLFQHVSYNDHSQNYLNCQFLAVSDYYNHRGGRRLAAFSRTYCNSPWTFLSVVAAVLLFLLTIEQAVFAALSYFSPR